jgi:hypothetical protein
MRDITGNTRDLSQEYRAEEGQSSTGQTMPTQQQVGMSGHGKRMDANMEEPEQSAQIAQQHEASREQGLEREAQESRIEPEITEDHRFAIQRDTGRREDRREKPAAAEHAPTASDAMRAGCDGLTLTTSFANQRGISKNLNEALEGAIAGLRGVVGGASGAKGSNSLSAGKVEGNSLLSPNSPALRGAANPEFMKQREGERNQQFAQEQPKF